MKELTIRSLLPRLPFSMKTPSWLPVRTDVFRNRIERIGQAGVAVDSGFRAMQAGDRVCAECRLIA